MGKWVIVIYIILTLVSCKSQHEYSLAKERAVIAEMNLSKLDSLALRDTFTRKYIYYLDCLIDKANSSTSTKLIRCGGYYIEKSSYSEPTCFSVGKIRYGRKKGMWEHYCNGDILSIKYYKSFSTEVLFRRITPNYSW